MKTLKLALGFLLATGAAALAPSSAHAQGAYGGAYGGGYGAGNQSAAAESRRQIKEAEAEVTRIRNDMNKIKARVAAKFEGKEEWETAQKNLKAAETAYAAATKKATAALQASPEYKAAKEKQIKSEQTIAAAAGAKKGNTKDLEKAQQDRLEAGLAIRKMETDALQNDAKVVETKAALADAKKAWEALQDELKEALQQDETYVAAEQELQSAQANVEQMKASAAQTAASERQARRQQQESMRQSGRGGRRGGGVGAYGGGGY